MKNITYEKGAISEIEKLIIKSTIRSIQIRLLKAKEQGRIINERAVNEILFEIEAPIKEVEIDEDGEETKEEDEEKINDAIDTTDLGARADMEWQNEKDNK